MAGKRSALIVASDTYQDPQLRQLRAPGRDAKELAAVLPQMDVGVMVLKNAPAVYYGTSPNKFFDYIACGLPVLNNYPGWLAEMIEAQGCGVVVPPDDPIVLADAVVRLRDSREDLREMGLRGRRLAESEFSREKLAGQFVATLERARAEFAA